VLVEVSVALSSRYDINVSDDELRAAGNIAGTVALLESKGVQP